ncbi:unnamed protein product [Cladocopium goreaui]|uniref:Uncharacterized protein n=1 Tax=Cladocopium goreaui TaxID=2562237 RepID=A0A9P1BG52_9DINO|nr:unnamed protein product [Cladocopium goreaui]
MDEVEEATEALLAWGQQALAAKPGASEASEASELKILHQEVEELEAQVALFGERQVRECRLSAKCEAHVVEAQMEAEVQQEREELRRMEDQVAQSEQALRRCDRRRTETAKFLKRAPELPDAKTHLEEEKLQESEQQELLRTEEELEQQFVQQRQELLAELHAEEFRQELVMERLRRCLSSLESSAAEAEEKAKECTALRSTAATVQERLEQCNSRVEDLEALAASCSKALRESSVQLVEFEQDSAVLHQELEEDVGFPVAEEMQEREEQLIQQMKDILEANSDSVAEDALEESKRQKAQLEEVVATIRAQLGILENCEELQESAFQLRDELKSLSLAQESLVQTRDKLEDEAKVQEQTAQEMVVVKQLKSELQLAEKVLLDDLSAKLAARERRVQLLAEQFRRRRSCQAEPMRKLIRKDEADGFVATKTGKRW